MHPGLTSSQARWNRCCYLGDVVHRCWLWPRAAPGPGPVLGGCDLPELVPIWSEYVTEVVPFGVARGCREPTRSLCRVWSRRMRVLRCACLPPLAACLRLVLSACGRVACACSGPALSSCTGPVEQVEPKGTTPLPHRCLPTASSLRAPRCSFAWGGSGNAFGLSATAWYWSHAGPHQPW